MYIKEDANLERVLQIGYVDVVNYEDIEIKYNDELRQFYFLRVGLKLMLGTHKQCYDVVTGNIVKLSNDWRHFSKQTILPEERAYTAEELEIIYNHLLDHKEEYLSKEVSEKSTNQVAIYADRTYANCEIDLTFDLNDHEYKYVAVRRIDGKPSYSFEEPMMLMYEEEYDEKLLKELSMDKAEVFKLRKEQEGVEFYNAITGEIISKEKLKNYEYCDKGEVFHDTIEYPVKALEISVNQLNKSHKTKKII